MMNVFLKQSRKVAEFQKEFLREPFCLRDFVVKTLFPVLVTVCSLSAQTSHKWENVYGGNGDDYGYSVKSCLDEGYIVAGSTASGGISDGYVVRTDSMGLVLWSKYFSGNDVDVLRSVKLLPDSGFIFAGYTNSTWSDSHGGYDAWAIRTDKNGNALWMKTYGTSDWDFFYDVAPTYDGGFVFIGGTYGRGAGDEDFYLVKTDASGDTLWTKTYGGTRTDEGRGIVQTGDSMLACCGFSYSLGDTLGDSWIMRMNAGGDTVWTRTAGYANDEDKAWGIADDTTFGRLFYCGQKSSPAGDEDACWGVFLLNGTQQFAQYTGGSLDEMFHSIVTRADGTFGTIGSDFTTGAGNGDMYLFQTFINWASFTYGYGDVEEGFGIDLTHDNGYIACGYSKSFTSRPDLYLVKIDSNGVSSGILGIKDTPSYPGLATTTVYPNPAQSQISIICNTLQPISGKPEMNVFDIAGRKVLSVPSDQWESNSSNSISCKIDVGLLDNGVYQFYISDKSGVKSEGKFVVLH